MTWMRRQRHLAGSQTRLRAWGEGRMDMRAAVQPSSEDRADTKGGALAWRNGRW
jgi:hypothetical protein